MKTAPERKIDSSQMEDTAVLNAADFLRSDSSLISFVIGSIRNEIKNRCGRILSKYDLTIRQILVIAYIGLHPDEVVTQKTLEDHMYLSNPTVTVLIQNMMKKGLVYREKVPTDGRKYRLLLTEKAKKLDETCYSELLAEENRFYQGMSPEEKQQLLTLLNKLERNLGIAFSTANFSPDNKK